MKKLPAFVIQFCVCLALAIKVLAYPDSSGHANAERELRYLTGKQPIAGQGWLTVPTGFSFLAKKDARYVIEEIWRNPKDESVEGLLLADDFSNSDESLAYMISYVDDGHVDDDEAEDIDYNEMMTTMQDDIAAEAEERKAQGYEAVKLLGWAIAPKYDAETHQLSWGKNLHFVTSSKTTLNYDMRLLGRSGHVQISAVGAMTQLQAAKAAMPSILKSFNFAKGHRYEDYDDKTDKLAAYGIGGLIAGKVLAKTGILAGLFAVLAKSAKLLIIGLGAGATALWRKFFGKKSEQV